MRTQELYAAVTAGIIADLEKGVASWVKPWKDGNPGGIMPVNAATRRAYSGINIPILWHAKESRGYASNEWMTYKQALPLDAHVRKGEKGTTVVFTKRVTVGKGEEDERQVAMLRTYTVFNVAQIDGLPTRPEEKQHIGPRTRTYDFIEATKATIRHGGDRAMYVPSQDFIQLPPVAAFSGSEHYLATALHELCHWTGHQSRLDRQLTGRFGTQAYAAEELVAELGAAFLCAHLGIEGKLRHAEYIANWLQLLRSDDRAIFTASSKASQAADYLRAFSESVQEEAA